MEFNDAEFEEFMSTYEFMLPAIERIVEQDRRMAEFERRLDELEGKPRPVIQYGLGERNPLLNAMKDLKGD